jgi:[acyl-carrier-protein] S-malonyltransferase
MGKTAFLFPGQGSQSVGMVRSLMEERAAVELFGQASEILGLDLWGLCLNGPDEKLNEDYYAQIAVHVTNCAFHAAMERRRMRPQLVSGFSLGLFSAAVAAGAISFVQSLRAVSMAAEMMAKMGERQKGAMAAVIGLTEGDVRTICEGVPGVFVASVNNARQIVIAGQERGVERAMKLSQKHGALLTRRLPVGWAIHTPLMEEVSQNFIRIIHDWTFEPPRVPIMSYLRAKMLSTSEELREDLGGQFSRPNRWYEALRGMIEGGVDRFIEVGPGDVLTRMVQWVSRDVRAETAGEILEAEGGDGQEVRRFSPLRSSILRGKS